MRKQTFFYLVIGLLIIMLVGTACQPSRRPVPQEDLDQLVPTENAPQEIQETEPPGEETAPETEVPLNGSGIPADIPVPETAYEVQVSRKGAYLQYKVDGEIADVVSFYQEEFPKLGWEETRSPDTALAAMATMLRQNENSDKVSINMQRNALGEFVFVTISIARAQQ
jgi:hypothetical protein